MPLFRIFPTDQTFSSAEIIADSPAAVFQIVGRLDCREADVIAADVYAFSVRLGDNGLWTIFQRSRDEGKASAKHSASPPCFGHDGGNGQSLN